KPIKRIILGTDGRYFSRNSHETVLRVALANGVEEIYTTYDTLLSTPASSLAVRTFKADVSILLTASHNEGGLKKDFGIKVENESGGILSETTNQKLAEQLKVIKNYHTLDGTMHAIYAHENVRYFDSVKLYADEMARLFDFDSLKKFLENTSLVLDGLHGVAGIYLKEIFKNRLGVKNLDIRQSESLPDFKGGHPEPNPLYAKIFYEELLEKPNTIGCAFDADVDRYMIVSEGQFLAPPDLLALYAKYLPLAKGYKEGLKGVARSMPTARILDYVVKDLGLDLYEVPTAWRYFTSLMDADKITLCGEESFGTGADYIREKDGIWGFLVWLNTLAQTGQKTSEIIHDLWSRYGRFYTCRYDFETTQEKAQAVFEGLKRLSPQIIEDHEIESVSEFNYTDPITKEYIPNQGWIVLFKDGSRVMTRLSNTGTKGALLRFYLEKREMKDFNADSFELTKDLGRVGMKALQFEEFLGTIKPDVIVKG
ncbi:MAG: alpha-D-glucose phosphate-specific phosphoglucomutase, partial [Alphaproteobacteria bacterium]|nr:alpha-D-glucose phosphate-specific phosphoglucomutase [Alphaproteobacteria bacterium]